MTFIKATHPDCMNEQHERFLGQIAGKFHTCCYTCGLAAERNRTIEALVKVLGETHPNVVFTVTSAQFDAAYAEIEK